MLMECDGERCGGFSVGATMTPQSTAAWHQPVMGAEALGLLDPRPGDVMVDGTAGTGGHSLMILPHLLPEGRLIAIDRDREPLELARKRLTEFTPQVTFAHGNFRNLAELLDELHVSAVDGVLLDLGMSSLQVDQPQRGFSFSKEGPLDMRMDHEQEETAGALVNELSADELEQLIQELGEERFARRIAQRILHVRRAKPIRTTTQLARIVAEAVPASARHGRIHVATRTFQALRMAVNDELGALEALLGDLPRILKPGGRAVILTFHSLEDRMVKRAFAQGLRDGRWAVLTKKPLRPSQEECVQNPRARCAKLRSIERI